MMDHLPQEIFGIIVEYVAADRWNARSLPGTTGGKSSVPLFIGYSMESRKWQACFEKYQFGRISLMNCDFDIFDREFQTLHRRTHLRTLCLDVVLLEYDDDARCRFERVSDQEMNDVVFTVVTAKLLHILHSWETQAASLPPKMEVVSWGAYSPSDIDSPEITDYVESANTTGDSPQNPSGMNILGATRYANSTIHLQNPEALPEVSFFKAFTPLYSGNTRRLDNGAIIEITQKFQNLWKAVFNIDDNCGRYSGIRRDNRHSFAQSLRHFPNMRKAVFGLWHEPPNDQKLKPPNVIYPYTCDPAGAAIRKTSKNLTHLTVDGVFDASLLWPYEDQSDPDSVEEEWPALEKLRIQLDLTTPSGLWYFKRFDFVSNSTNDDEDSDAETPEEDIDDMLVEYPQVLSEIDPSAAPDSELLGRFCDIGEKVHGGKIQVVYDDTFSTYITMLS